MLITKLVMKPLLDLSVQRFNINLPESLYAQIENKESIQLSFGNRSLTAYANKGRDALELSDDVASQLAIPLKEQTILAKYNLKENQIKIGPVLAVLTVDSESEHENGPFGPLSAFYYELARYCLQNHLFFYVISLRSKHSDTELIGYRFINNEWGKCSLPLPDVIYNRISSRKYENSDEAKKLFTLFQKESIPVFNERFLNKWDVYRMLADNPVLVPHLPETILYEKASDLDSMLQSHTVVFAKPTTGSLGRGIVRMMHTNGQYVVHFSNKAPVLNDHEPYNLLPLLRTVVPILRRQPYILQQGIKTITHNNQSTDFRILCNKDKTGTWNVTSIVARCSANEQFVANVAMGGSLHHPKNVLSPLFSSRETNEIMKLLTDLSLQCAITIEQHCNGTYGELGVDLAIDEDGKPWILEVNTKPSKNDDSTFLLNENTIRPSTKALVQFATYLAGFEWD